MAKTKFSDFMLEVEAEAKAEGRDAVEELRAFRDHFRLARELIEARKAKGLSQRQLADLCGLHQSEVSNIERGHANPTSRTLHAVARGLGRRLGLVPAGTERRIARKQHAVYLKRSSTMTKQAKGASRDANKRKRKQK